MKTLQLTDKGMVAAILALLVLTLPMGVSAQGPMMDAEDGDGYGMMHGYGPGYGRGYGSGCGMGMMGGMGYGMMGPGMGMMGPGMGYGMGFGGPLLDLSEAQREKMVGIQRGLRQEQYERMGDMLKAREAMQAELLKQQPDPEAVAEAFDKVSAVRREMLKARIRAQNEMRAVLTDEQREKLRGMGGYPW